jgi:YD repeat-containing protein
VDGRLDRRRAAAFLAGWQGSAREHLIWEETVHVPAVSTARVFQVARQQSVSILTIDRSNASLIASLPFDTVARDDLRDKVNAGLLARVPERTVTWGQYQNVVAYVVEDPITGSADYRLWGTFNGGQAAGEGSPPSGPGCPACSGGNPDAGSSVSISGGNMFFAEADLTVPARGIPVAFTRRYDSRSPYGGRLGPGWQHSYEVKLVLQPDGSVVYVNDSFREQRFERLADGSYVAEPGYHERLEAVGEDYRLTFKDGIDYRFRADGQLESIRDLNGHAVLLEYDGEGKLGAVRDAGMRKALAFAYEPSGQLASVIDLAGRTVAFGHASGDLVSVTDVLGHAQTYGYDGAHRLVSKTDRNGNTIQEFYDGEGRWIGSREPDGHGR